MPKSKDLMSQDLQIKLAAALESESTESVAKVFVEFADQLQQDILADAEAYRQTEDNRILAERGVRVLTSEEKEYYDKFIQAARSEEAWSRKKPESSTNTELEARPNMPISCRNTVPPQRSGRDSR